jgi:DNA polymerase-3 subunit epsilon
MNNVIQLTEAVENSFTVRRSVLFDTETTGLDARTGDRVIEIAALELANDLPTGQHFHCLIDPERDIPEGATRIHGLTAADLRGKPRFADIVDDMLAFFGDDPLVAHNAPFDFGMLNAELERLGRPPLANARMVDTLVLAKKLFPGMPNSLDALCRRHGIDLSQRTTHNALLDCRLLAEVYIELTGGRQRGLSLVANIKEEARAAVVYEAAGEHQPHPIIPDTAELALHAVLLTKLRGAIWLAEEA